MWEFYLAYCEAGFASGYLDVARSGCSDCRQEQPMTAWTHDSRSGTAATGWSAPPAASAPPSPTELVAPGRAGRDLGPPRGRPRSACPADTMTVVPLDVTDRDAVAAPPTGCRRALGGLDVVVWCAGLLAAVRRRDWDPEVFARHVEVNLLGLNNVLAAVLPQMLARGRGAHGRDRLGGGLPRARRAPRRTARPRPRRSTCWRRCAPRWPARRPGDHRLPRLRPYGDDRRQHVPDAVHHRGRRGRPGDRRRPRASTAPRSSSRCRWPS